jgi:hypothetical protein
MAHTTRLYCDEDDLKAALSIGTADTADDDVLHAIAETVSRLIDNYTGTTFYTVAAGTAYYTAPNNAMVEIDPFTSITEVATDDDGDGTYKIVWTTADYVPLPLNATLDQKPITALQVSINGNLAFPPELIGAVRIKGAIGWPNGVPAAVKQAAILAGVSLYESRKAPFGIVGSTETGAIRMTSRLHPAAQLLLEEYRLHDGVVA